MSTPSDRPSGESAPRDEAALEERLSRPSPALAGALAPVSGDLIVLGAGGKMGPSLARRVHRALAAAGSRHRVVAASRFSSAAARGELEDDGIATRVCDLLDPAGLDSLPRAPYVLFLAGRKFGTTDRTDLTWATNTIVPALRDKTRDIIDAARHQLQRELESERQRA